ncbi:hypothetical protein RI844_07190 [Thalassotalea fonticola]|uniref:Uncharacterized protein n=1 Tax=Thalassotalea fonticola TaxID=3065649 RepID=A0ABZ0GUE3_9GAMM|nr:hypothetical protein RI844_07190 [Colwelliaceae bacterium S1-1]
MSNKDNKNELTKKEVLNNRREFISKYGKLAIATPIAVTALMTPMTSRAQASLEDSGDII